MCAVFSWDVFWEFYSKYWWFDPCHNQSLRLENLGKFQRLGSFIVVPTSSLFLLSGEWHICYLSWCSNTTTDVGNRTRDVIVYNNNCRVAFSLSSYSLMLLLMLLYCLDFSPLSSYFEKKYWRCRRSGCLRSTLVENSYSLSCCFVLKVCSLACMCKWPITPINKKKENKQDDEEGLFTNLTEIEFEITGEMCINVCLNEVRTSFISHVIAPWSLPPRF